MGSTYSGKTSSHTISPVSPGGQPSATTRTPRGSPTSTKNDSVYLSVSKGVLMATMIVFLVHMFGINFN
ncbi:hypothetical protein K7432_009138 [Basidiobolus ranarum]|uniref:Uncharacterized protein n=1 Tax=Basidiobolus ranarum TaxID=34480 RepID=A0ABR2WQQ7_9FUNG